ncbi:MAG TPA: helix-turn-helix domain-containing protein [Chloroflexia bacterium]|nr:helix-turn-helix domain-containing protein [Chloroflexia bacterium]
MPPTGFKFIDLPDAAQRLGITRLKLLEWVGEGKIRPFSGSGQQSVFRAADVEKLAQELGIPAPHSTAPTQEVAQTSAQENSGGTTAPSTARPKRRDPVKLIGTRLSMDSRWAEISDEDIATWLDAIEPVQYDRVRKVATLTIERLERVMAMMDQMKRDDGR